MGEPRPGVFPRRDENVGSLTLAVQPGELDGGLAWTGGGGPER
jgi:hypothetical protein